MNRYIVIATRDELPLVDRLPFAQPCPVIITGVGATNVIEALKNLPRDSEIYSIGYAGSPNIMQGNMVKVGRCLLQHSVDYAERVYDLGEGVTCYTGTDFQKADIKPGCVYDMELAIICSLGFRVRAYKVVSDQCDYEQYKNFIKKLAK